MSTTVNVDNYIDNERLGRDMAMDYTVVKSDSNDYDLPGALHFFMNYETN